MDRKPAGRPAPSQPAQTSRGASTRPTATSIHQKDTSGQVRPGVRTLPSSTRTNAPLQAPNGASSKPKSVQAPRKDITGSRNVHAVPSNPDGASSTDTAAAGGAATGEKAARENGAASDSAAVATGVQGQNGDAVTEQDLSVSIRETVWQNLLLLGFQDIRDAHTDVLLDRDMFLQRNQKALELVFHFLFTKAAPDEAPNELKECWPIVKQRQELLFRKAIKAWLTRLESVPEAGIPSVDSRLLVQPDESLYYPLLRVTSHVMRTVAVRDLKANSQRPYWSGYDMDLSSDMVHRALMHHQAKATLDLIGQATANENTQTRWLQYSQQLTTEYRAWHQKENQLQGELHRLRSAGIGGGSEEVRQMRMQAVREVQGFLHAWRVGAAQDIDMLQWMTSGTGHRHHLHVTPPSGPLPPQLADVWSANAPVKPAPSLVTEQGSGLETVIRMSTVGLANLLPQMASIGRSFSSANSVAALNLAQGHQEAHRRNLASAQLLAEALRDLQRNVRNELEGCRRRWKEGRPSTVESTNDPNRLYEASAPLELFSVTQPALEGDEHLPLHHSDLMHPLSVPSAESLAAEARATAMAKNAQKPDTDWLTEARWELEQQQHAALSARNSIATIRQSQPFLRHSMRMSTNQIPQRASSMLPQHATTKVREGGEMWGGSGRGGAGRVTRGQQRGRGGRGGGTTGGAFAATKGRMDGVTANPNARADNIAAAVCGPAKTQAANTRQQQQDKPKPPAVSRPSHPGMPTPVSLAPRTHHPNTVSYAQTPFAPPTSQVSRRLIFDQTPHTTTTTTTAAPTTVGDFQGQGFLDEGVSELSDDSLGGEGEEGEISSRDGGDAFLGGKAMAAELNGANSTIRNNIPLPLEQPQSAPVLQVDQGEFPTNRNPAQETYSIFGLGKDGGERGEGKEEEKVFAEMASELHRENLLWTIQEGDSASATSTASKLNQATRLVGEAASDADMSILDQWDERSLLAESEWLSGSSIVPGSESNDRSFLVSNTPARHVGARDREGKTDWLTGSAAGLLNQSFVLPNTPS